MEIQARLQCLGPPRLCALGDTLALDERGRTEPVELLLRIAAAGPPGLALPALIESLWPALSARQRRARFDDCARCLALLVGGEGPVLLVEGDLVAIDPDRLAVDSLELENALGPLLVPFQRNSGATAGAARAALSAALARDPVFLPGFDAPWARVARHRIADKLARATGRCAVGELEQ